VTALLLIEF